MPRCSSDSGLAFAIARRVNMKATIDGTLRLAGVNMLPDPGFREFEPDGSLRFWQTRGPPVRSARNVYVGEGRGPERRQNGTLIPWRQASYVQSLDVDPTGPGLPPARSRHNDVVAARHPTLDTRPGGSRGYQAGVYPASYAWVVGSLYDRRRRALTNPAPPMWATLAEGQSYELPLPEEPAEGALGIAILQGEPDGPFDLLYVQEIIDIRAFMPSSRVMDGPLRTSQRAPRVNETYCGGFGRLPGPDIRRTAGIRRLRRMDVLCSYKFRTDLGVSASQGTTRYIVNNEHPNSALRFFFPPMPKRAIAVIPQIQAPDSSWYDLDYGLRGGDVPIIPGWNWRPFFFTDDPGGEKEILQYESSDRSEVDETGLPGPDTALEQALTFGLARLTPGRKTVRTSDLYRLDDELVESPPSVQRVIDVPQGHDLVADFREEAEQGNAIPNPEFDERKPDGDPRRFSFPATPSALLSVRARRSVVHFDDRTGRTGVETIYETDIFRYFGESVYTLRGGVRFDGAIGSRTGRGRISITFYDINADALGTYHLFTSDTAELEECRYGPVGSGADVEIPGAPKFASIAWTLVGSATEPRDLSGRFVHVGFFRGRSAARKHDGEYPVPDIEDEEEPYPDGGYMAVVESPSWAENRGNGLEWFGQATARRPRYFAFGHQVPLDPNRVYILHGSYSCRGAIGGTAVLPVTIRASSGRVLENKGHCFQIPESRPDGGDASGTFQMLIETGQRASYLEFGESDLGWGLVRVWGLQLEFGAAASPWSDEYEPTGSVAATFDTQTPGMESSPALASRLYGIKHILSADATAEIPDGTSVEVRMRGKHRPEDQFGVYVRQAENLDATRIVEVEALVSTNVANVTPELDDVYILTEPPRSVLLRADGSEYTGGALIEGMPSTGYGESTEESQTERGGRRIRELHEPERELAGLTIKAMTDEGAEEIMYDAAHGERLFVAEGRGFRRLVRILQIQMVPNRSETIAGGFTRHEATDVKAYVLDEQPMTATDELVANAAQEP